MAITQQQPTAPFSKLSRAYVPPVTHIYPYFKKTHTLHDHMWASQCHYCKADFNDLTYLDLYYEGKEPGVAPMWSSVCLLCLPTMTNLLGDVAYLKLMRASGYSLELACSRSALPTKLQYAQKKFVEDSLPEYQRRRALFQKTKKKLTEISRIRTILEHRVPLELADEILRMT